MRAHRRRIATGLVAVALLAALLLTAACGSSPGSQGGDGNVIRVGVAGPMEFVQGEHHWYGATMAVEEINAAGGVQVGDETYTIELVRIDTNEIRSVSDATSALERAVAQEGIQFLMGGFRSEAVAAMQEIAMDNRLIFLGTGAGAPELNAGVAENYDRYKYWFRVTPVNSTHLGRISFIQLATVAAFVRQALGVETPKVALVAEGAQWADGVVPASEQTLPTLGLELVGVWRPSPTATDVTAELTAIADSGAHIIFAWLSGPVGIPFARQWGELQVPAALMGINVEGQKLGFWDATDGKGNYALTLNTYGRVPITDKTIPFYDAFVQRFGEFPTYNAGTYDALYVLKDAIERAGALDADAVVAELEKTDAVGTAGRLVFDETHDVTWGPGYVTGLGTQWVDGELKVVWPYNWEGITYEGTEMYALPPWVIEHHRGQ